MKLATRFLIAIVTLSFCTTGWCVDDEDYKAIEAAVKAGKLTREQADEKLAYLKKEAEEKTAKKPARKAVDKRSQKKPPAKTTKSSPYEAIEAAVKSGKLTKEEAARKLEYLKKASEGKGTKIPARKDAKLSAYKAIEAAVKAGKITKEQAAEKLSYLKKAAAKPQKKPTPKPTKLSPYEAIEAAVKSGKLTKEEAAHKLEYLKKATEAKAATKPASKNRKTKGGQPKEKQSNEDGIAAALSKLVKSGLISERQAKAMLAAARNTK